MKKILISLMSVMLFMGVGLGTGIVSITTVEATTRCTIRSPGANLTVAPSHGIKARLASLTPVTVLGKAGNYSNVRVTFGEHLNQTGWVPTSSLNCNGL